MFSSVTPTNAANYKNLVTGGNDPTATQTQKFSAMVQNSQASVIYRGLPNATETSYTATDPIFAGDVLVQGNVNVQPALGTAAYNSGWLNIGQNISVGETIYANNICVSGNILFLNQAYFATLNIATLKTIKMETNTGIVNALTVKQSTVNPVLHMLGNSAMMPIYYSVDNGVTWNACVFTTNGTNERFLTNVRQIVFNGNYWIAVGQGSMTTDSSNNGSIMYSDNGITWMPVDSGNVFSKTGGYGLAWNGTTWVASGDGQQVVFATSLDGMTWVPNTDTYTKNIFTQGYSTGVVHNGLVWVASGSADVPTSTTSTLAYSYDASNWLILDANNPIIYNGCNNVAWNGTIFLACGGDGTSMNNLAYSYNGIDWLNETVALFTRPILGVRWSASRNQWIAIGTPAAASSLLATSTDAVTWTDISGVHGLVESVTDVFWESASSQWVLTGMVAVDSGFINKLFTSPDGTTWTPLANNSIRAMALSLTMNAISTNFAITGILNVAGKAFFGDTVTLNKTMTIQAGVPSTSVNTGSLVVHGGIGVDNNIYVDGDVRAGGGVWVKNLSSGDWVQIGQNAAANFSDPLTASNTASSYSVDNNGLIVRGGVGIAKTLYVNTAAASTNVNTGAVVAVGGLGIGGNANIGGNTTIGGNLVATGGATVAALNSSGNVDISGVLRVQNTQSSTSIGSGALTVTGGAGVAGNLNVGGNVRVSSLTNSLNVTSGAVIVAGGSGWRPM